MTFLNDRLVSHNLDSFHFHGNTDRIYQIRVLETIGAAKQQGLAGETKPIVCKHKQKQMQPSPNKHQVMVRSLDNEKLNLNS